MTVKYWLSIFGALLGFELLSYFAFATGTVQPVSVLVSIALIAVCLYRWEWGILMVLLELFVGGKGYLLALSLGPATVSLRMILFVAIMLGWLVAEWRQRQLAQSFRFWRGFKLAWVVFFIAVAGAVLQGLVLSEKRLVYLDANAWIFWLLAFPMSRWLKGLIQLEKIVELLFISVIFTGAKTVIMLILFSRHIVSGGSILYHWIRQTGVGEITQMDENFFRIFFQSHVYSLIAVFIILVFLCTKHVRTLPQAGLSMAALYAGTLNLMLSQSRSFWAAALMTAVLLFFIHLVAWRKNLISSGLITFFLIGVIFSQISLIQLASGYYLDIFTQRIKTAGQDESGASRIQQLRPLLEGIKARPLTGWGFGKTLTYISNDPRVRATRPDGAYTTYAFEWGYLDMALKLGLVGLGFYFFFVYSIFSRFFRVRTVSSWAMLVAGFSLIATHVFTPYLNHPLGIGFLVILYGYARQLEADEFQLKEAEK